MKKKKWNKIRAVLLVMVIASVRLWQQKRGKRRCRNNHGVLMEHKPV